MTNLCMFCTILILAGCGAPGDNSGAVAGMCGVTEAELERVVAEVKAKPSAPQKIGGCDVRVDASGLLSVAPISSKTEGG